MLVLVVGVRFLGVVLVGVRVLVVGALIPSSLLPPPSSAAVSVQGRRHSYTGASGRLAAAGFGADARSPKGQQEREVQQAELSEVLRSRPQQSEVQQVELLHRSCNSHKAGDCRLHEEFEERLRKHKSESARKTKQSSGVDEAREQ